ncbi:MAG TPA: hypothetical protein PKO15_02295 [Fibrobacteria bacterium]|nr:hypothetical protein [Fibrobacteria bacterium]HOX49925.1 hypothetical protein [Fibrobacteria bacterium]
MLEQAKEYVQRFDFSLAEKWLWLGLRSLYLASITFSVINFSVSGSSVYFYMFVPFVDLPFIKWIYGKKWKANTTAWVFFLVALSMFQIFNGSFLKDMIRPVWLFVLVFYAIFLYREQYKAFRLLYVFCSISVLFGVIQLFSVFVGVEEYFFPTSIGKMIWGEYAILARSGFEDGVIFPYRIAGLSKEPGFLSSLLLVVTVVLLKDGQLARRQKKLFLAILIGGILLSFSKITLVFLGPTVAAYFVKRWIFPIQKIPLIVGAAFFSLVLMVGSRALYEDYGLIKISYLAPWYVETYLHRTIGYYLLNRMDADVILGSFFFGGITQNLPAVLHIAPFLANLQFVDWKPEVVFFSSCLMYVAFQYGILFLFGYIGMLRSLKVNMFDFLVFILAISSVNPFAFENFVVLGYLILVPRLKKENSWKQIAQPEERSYLTAPGSLLKGVG